MAGLRLISTRRVGRGDLLTLAYGRTTLKITDRDLLTQARLDSDLTRLKSALGITDQTAIFFHVNRDGTLAVASGKLLLRWPEDDQRPPTQVVIDNG